VFWYPEEMRIARQPSRHYSGLTQAYYAEALFEAYRATGDDALRSASERVFRSLLIPQQEGGVLYEWEDGVAIAEVPTSPRDLILNGWLSILAAVHDYAAATGSAEAERLFSRSAATVAKLLPLYDAPVLRNSRYGLTGPVSLRLAFDGPTTGIRVHDLRVDIPKEGSFSVPVDKRTRWEYWVDPDTARANHDGFEPKGPKVLMNVVLSRLPYPSENVVKFSIDSPRATSITLAAHVGTYDPRSAEQVHETWQSVRTVSVAAGRTDVEAALPWDLVDLIAYPTNFLKKLGGEPTNVYHAVHIQRLRSLAEWTGDSMFARWADKWEGYICDWSTMPLYAGLSVRDYRSKAAEVGTDPASFCG
jgi:hypothetical protein